MHMLLSILPPYEPSRFHQIYFRFHQIFRTTGNKNSNSDEFLSGGGGLTVRYSVAIECLPLDITSRSGFCTDVQ